MLFIVHFLKRKNKLRWWWCWNVVNEQRRWRTQTWEVSLGAGVGRRSPGWKFMAAEQAQQAQRACRKWGRLLCLSLATGTFLTVQFSWSSAQEFRKTHSVWGKPLKSENAGLASSHYRRLPSSLDQVWPVGRGEKLSYSGQNLVKNLLPLYFQNYSAVWASQMKYV